MATSRLYFYPEAAGALYNIDLEVASAQVGDVQETLSSSMASAARSDGLTYRAHLGGQIHLDIRLSLVLEPAQQREIHNFRTHIKRGGSFGLALDKDIAWGSVLLGPTPQGSVGSIVSGQQWYEPTVSLPSGTPIIFEQAWPDFNPDAVTLGGAIDQTTNILVHDAVYFDHTPVGGRPVHVRADGFWPVLRLRPDAYRTKLFEWTRRYYYDVTLPVVYDLAAAANVAASGGVLQIGEQPGQGESTQQAVLGFQGLASRDPFRRD